MSYSLDFQPGSYLLPQGFISAGISAGIKKKASLDLGILLSVPKAATAGMFTSSRFRGHCIDICRDQLTSNRYSYGCIVNSGNSNTATGALGRSHSERMRQALAEQMQQSPAWNATIQGADLLISHTGVIGFPLPIDKIEESIPNFYQFMNSTSAVQDCNQESFARAIMTTDTRPKSASVLVTTTKGHFRLSGVAKGAGMIAPNMATMLCYLSTDANLAPELLQELLEKSVQRSFNSITIDGDMSPDDSILLFANGASQVNIIAGSEEAEAFDNGLQELTMYLAKEIVRDGEGANKLVTISVSGAATVQQAKQAALTIANSMLVKTAFFGEDANWGRILTALGYSGVPYQQEDVQLFFGSFQLCRDGQGLAFDEDDLKKYLSQAEFAILLKIGKGDGQATVFTSDLSYDYVKINADYRS